MRKSRTQSAEATTQDQSTESPVSIVKCENSGVEAPTKPATGWELLRDRICTNYGIEPPQVILQQPRKCALNTLAVIDIAEPDGQSICGWIVSSSEIPLDTRLYFGIGQTVIATALTACERPDINTFFEHNFVVSFKFMLEDCAAVSHPANAINALSVNIENDTPYISILGNVIECACVNSVTNTGFIDNFLARQKIEQFRYTANPSDKVNHAERIALIANNIDLNSYIRDTKINFKSPLDAAEHYYLWGEQDGIMPCSWFNLQSYITRFKVDIHQGNGFFHYLSNGRLGGLKLSNSYIDPQSVTLEMLNELALPLFDAEFYRKQIDNANGLNKETLLTHYFQNSEDQSTNPMEGFSTAYYREQNPDIASTGLHPFAHYVLYGQYENRRPHPKYFSHDIKLHSDPRKSRSSLCLPELNLVQSEPSTSTMKIGIHIHAYYVDELEPILDHIGNIPNIETIYVSTDTTEKEQGINAILNSYDLSCKTEVAVVENRGRDVLPLINWLRNTPDDYDLILHLHTKKSVHLGDYGNAWFNDILKRLIGTPASVAALIQYFETVENAGIAYPETREEHYKFLRWGDNRQLADSLFDLLDIDKSILTSQELDFPAGNMFWFRPAALKPIFTGAIEAGHFPTEPIDVDGTIAHTIERCIPYVASSQGFESIKINTVPYSILASTKSIKPTVSIIIPMHNCEAHLNATIESIINQGTIFSTLEVILVENNSTDNTLAIARHYTSCFHNIHLFHELKQGAGNARNLGMDKAKGSYIAFLDADDILPNNAIEELYTLASANAAEITTSRLRMFDAEGFSMPMPCQPKDYLVEELVMLDIEQYNNAMNNYRISEPDTQLLKTVFSDFGPCAKLYSAEFIEQNGLRFPCDTNYEDNIFVYSAYLACSKFLATKAVSYLYRRNHDYTQSSSRDIAAAQDASTAIRYLSDLTESIENENLSSIMRNAIADRVSSLLDESAGHEKFQATIRSSIVNAA